MTDPKSLIERLSLQPHPEGGWYAETHRDAAADGGRGSLTQIYYLLEAGQHSRWHRVTDATEVWHHYAGDPLELLLSEDGRAVTRHLLGSDFDAGARPQLTIAPNVWQAARPLGAWSLCGCTVAPAFAFSGFEMAPEGWEPGG